MAESISQALRREVRTRAGGRCEYCLMPESVLLAGCEVDHIISRKHGGITDGSNLALSCARCNRAKGTDVGSVSPGGGVFTRLFNPRIDGWPEHFAFDGARIAGRTEVGEVTARLLRFNEDERVLERSLLQSLGDYPGQVSR
jgi:hypothetical protein